jgi:dGTPase
MMYKRERLEQIEQQTLAPYALKSADSKGRAYPEAESATRTAFERDRDRIIHTTAFRRLEYKTQVFVIYEGDHYRTRLTHTLEVAQLGRSLARNLGGNELLTEAICLAHDLGHPPFGHAGEFVLNRLMDGYGGFNHNAQSYRVVTELEQRYPNFPGLNLTYETREGIVKHETEYDKSDAGEYAPEKRASLEAQIANLADEMAYNAHDLEDGLRAELFPLEDLSDLTLWRELRELIGWNGKPFTELTRREVIRELIGLFVIDVLETTSNSLAAGNIDSVDKLQAGDRSVVGYSPVMAQKVRQLKDFLYERMYNHYRLVRMHVKAERIIEEMFGAYLREPKMLPEKTLQRADKHEVRRVITDYIAGMTDRFALEEWQKIFDPYARA